MEEEQKHRSMILKYIHRLLKHFSFLILCTSLIAFVSISVHAGNGINTSSQELTGACVIDSAGSLVGNSSGENVHVEAFPPSIPCYVETTMCGNGSNPPCPPPHARTCEDNLRPPCIMPSITPPEPKPPPSPVRTCEDDLRSPCIVPPIPKHKPKPKFPPLHVRTCEDDLRPPCIMPPIPKRKPCNNEPSIPSETEIERCENGSPHLCLTPPNSSWLPNLLGLLLVSVAGRWIYGQFNITARQDLGVSSIEPPGINQITSEMSFKLVWKSAEQVIRTDSTNKLIIAGRKENE